MTRGRSGDGRSAPSRHAGRAISTGSNRHLDGGESTSRRGEVLIALARDAIARELGMGATGAADAAPGGAVDRLPEALERALEEPGACFVTLHTRGRLHGCIGSIEPRRSLREDVESNARSAAFRDRRFPPLTREDLGETTIEVSLLSPMEPVAVSGEAEALRALRPGVDGVLFEAGGHRATFLPQVWASLPDPRAFLQQLRRKAGLPQNYWSDDVMLHRYTVTAFDEAAS